MSERFKLEPGDLVVYVDALGRPHNALVTDIQGPVKFSPPETVPSVSIAHVDIHTKFSGHLGHKVQRYFAVAHSSRTSGPGHFWRMPEEKLR